jgi:hypothetical protein
MTDIQHKGDLLAYLISQSDAGKKDWFSFPQQKIAGVNLCYEMAARYADKMTPEEIADYAKRLNDAIYKIIVSAK